MTIEKAICPSCNKPTSLIQRSHDKLCHSLAFVCEHCHVTNHVKLKTGSIAIPSAFLEAFGYDQLLTDNLENEQTLTINITVKSNTLSRKALKKAFRAISVPLTGNIFAYILTNFPLYSGGEPGRDFTVKFIKDISD